MDAGVHAVGEPPVRTVVADLQTGAGTQGRKIGAAEPVGVPGDPDRTAGAQDRDPHGQGILEQLGRAAVPPASRPAAAVRDAVRGVRDDDIDPAALEQLRRRQGVGRIQEQRLGVVAADLRLEQVAEPPSVAA